MCDTAECRQAHLLAGGGVREIEDVCAMYGVPLPRCRSELKAASRANTLAIHQERQRLTAVMAAQPATTGPIGRGGNVKQQHSKKCPAGVNPADWAVSTGRVRAGSPMHQTIAAMARGDFGVAAETAERFEPGLIDLLDEVKASGLVPSTAAAPDDDYRALFGDDGSQRIAATSATPPRAPARVAASGPPVSGAIEFPSRFAPQSVAIDPYASNPLLEDLRQVAPATVQSATRGGPAATLFAAGDVPPYTASGNDPRALLKLPWMVRHAAAKADAAGWARIFDAYSADVDAAAFSAEAADPGNDEYLQRFTHWGSTSGVNTAGDAGV